MERTLFQKRHYELFADLLREAKQVQSHQPASGERVIERLQDSMIQVMQADNPRFNAAKFKEACQP